MNIKIPSGPPEGKAVEAVEEAGSAVESVKASEVSEIATTEIDGISRIAGQVASGEITRDQAVEQILAEVLDSNMVKAAPGELSVELTEVLKALLETDPHLKSLLSVLGPAVGD